MTALFNSVRERRRNVAYTALTTRVALVIVVKCELFELYYWLELYELYYK